MKFFEDIGVGERSEIGAYTFSVEDINAFATQFDPRPLLRDEPGGGASPVADVRASAWHVACVWMRLLIEHRQREDAARRARGEPIAMLGPSPGFRDLKSPHPVCAGDTITYATEVAAKRVSISRPEWGLITARNTGVNQRREPVLSFTSTAFVARRGHLGIVP